MRWSFGFLSAIFACGCGSNGNMMMQGSCDLSKATPTMHTSLNGSETWASGVHVVPSTLTIPVGATLTIAACNKVQLGAGAGFTVDGSLVVAGTSTGPVTFDPSAAGQAWGTIKLNPNGTADLTYATFTGGGGSDPVESSGVLAAAIYVQGNGGPPPPSPLKVSHVDVEQASGVGIALVNAGFDSASDALTIHAAKAAPLYLGADVAGSIPAGTYTGNANDLIYLQSAFAAAQDNQRPIIRDVTIHDRGIPYCVGAKDASRIDVGKVGVSPAPALTIEAGVTLAFTPGASKAGRLNVIGDSSTGPTMALGALVANGTAAKPIVFTSCSATPAAGDWIGITLTGLDSRTSLQGVGIDSAGAPSGVLGVCLDSGNTHSADAALQILYQSGAPAASILTGSVISNSAGSGIYRGWKAADVDFVTGNMLKNVALCAQTLVPDASNACPATACMTVP